MVNDQLYADGGFDGSSYLKTVEVLDRNANQWRLVGCMNYRRLGGGVGVIRALNDHDNEEMDMTITSSLITTSVFPTSTPTATKFAL